MDFGDGLDELDDAEEITEEQIMALRAQRLYARIVDTTFAIPDNVFQAVIVCYYLTFNNHLAVCLQALLFTLGCFTLSEDRNGAYILIGLQLVYILFNHHVKSVIGSFVLMTVLTLTIKPFYAFMYMLRHKAYLEVFIYSVRYFYYINAILPDHLTDYIYLGMYLVSEYRGIFHRPFGPFLDDLFLAGILLAFTYIFYMRQFTEEAVCLTSVAIILWMYVRSRYTPMWERLIS